MLVKRNHLATHLVIVIIFKIEMKTLTILGTNPRFCQSARVTQLTPLILTKFHNTAQSTLMILLLRRKVINVQNVKRCRRVVEVTSMC